MNIDELAREFLYAQDGYLSVHTLDWYRTYLRPLKETHGTQNIDDISLQDLRALFSATKSMSASDFTLFNFVRAWRRLFGWATEEGLLSQNPAARLRLPPLPKKSPSAITEENAKKLFYYASHSSNPERDVAILYFLRETGARVGGIANLTTYNLDIDHLRAIVVEKGRGGPVERQVFFSKKSAQALKNWLSVRPANGDDERIFLLTESGIYQVLKRLATISGIQGRWNPHSFRHAFARRLLAKGASIGVVSHFMGHSSVQVTLDFYGRFTNDELQEIYNQLTQNE